LKFEYTIKSAYLFFFSFQDIYRLLNVASLDTKTLATIKIWKMYTLIKKLTQDLLDGIAFKETHRVFVAPQHDGKSIEKIILGAQWLIKPPCFVNSTTGR
jgi:hypothetical protein